MKKLIVEIEEGELARLNLNTESVNYASLRDVIERNYLRRLFREGVAQTAREGGDLITMEEIQAEVNAVRNAKNRS